MEAMTGVSSTPCRRWQLRCLLQPLSSSAPNPSLQLRGEDSYSLTREAKTRVSIIPYRWWLPLHLLQPLPSSSLTPSLQLLQEVIKPSRFQGQNVKLSSLTSCPPNQTSRLHQDVHIWISVRQTQPLQTMWNISSLQS